MNVSLTTQPKNKPDRLFLGFRLTSHTSSDVALTRRALVLFSGGLRKYRMCDRFPFVVLFRHGKLPMVGHSNNNLVLSCR